MRELFNWAEFPTGFATAAEACGFLPEVLLDTEDGAITAWERKGDGPVVYISAGMHGDEPAGPLALLEMMEAGWLPGNFHWFICPVLNPGGLALGTRENRQGCDLNRDYFRRKSLEIAAHTRWLSRQPVPSLFVSLHEDWESEGFYFYEINLACDDTDRSHSILDAVAPFFPPEPCLRSMAMKSGHLVGSIIVPRPISPTPGRKRSGLRKMAARSPSPSRPPARRNSPKESGRTSPE